MATKVTYWATLIDDEGFPQEYREETYSLTGFLVNLLETKGDLKLKSVGLLDEKKLSEVISPTAVPAVPTGLTATVVDDTHITIDHAVVDDALWYEYDVNGGDGVQYAFSALPITVGSLTADTEYTFRVRSGNAAGASAWSTGVAKKTKAGA